MDSVSVTSTISSHTTVLRVSIIIYGTSLLLEIIATFSKPQSNLNKFLMKYNYQDQDLTLTNDQTKKTFIGFVLRELRFCSV
jgi:hypothetical protein